MALSGPGPSICSPAIAAMPAVGWSKPALMLSSVDFPQPDGPLATTNSPLRICRLMSCSTLFSPASFVTKVRSSPSQETITSGFCMDARFPVPAKHNGLDRQNDAVGQEAHEAERDHRRDDDVEPSEG